MSRGCTGRSEQSRKRHLSVVFVLLPVGNMGEPALACPQKVDVVKAFADHWLHIKTQGCARLRVVRHFAGDQLYNTPSPTLVVRSWDSQELKGLMRWVTLRSQLLTEHSTFHQD